MKKPLTEALVEKWRAALTPARRKVLAARGIRTRTQDRYEVGWDGYRYTIPIRDRAGALVNVRRYHPKPAQGQSKMLNLAGWGSPTRLAFGNRIPSDPSGSAKSFVLVTGGEWDALSAAQAGFIAVSSTNGEGSVPDAAELEVMRGWDVAVCLDADAAGARAAVRWAEALVDVAANVKVVVLPEPKDVNDWFAVHKRTGAELMDLIRDTPKHGVQRPSGDMVAGAVAKLSKGTPRNEAGFWLACQLRDERYAEDMARDVMGEFVAQVGTLKSPPYTEQEAESSLHQAFSRPPRSASGHARSGYLMTDVGNAERLVDQHGDDMRWVPEFGRWSVWDGKRWNTRGGLTVESWAKQTARSIFREARGATDDKARAALNAHALRSESSNKVKAAIEMARSEPGIAVSPRAFDVDRMLLNCANGTVDLRTGSLREHNRTDMCSRLSPVAHDPQSCAPRWDAFLARVVPDPDVRAFLQRAIGYSLTGETSEQKMMMLYGYGANGKTTFCEVVKEIAGDYGQQMPFETLLEKKHSGVPNDIARLDGARFVLASESRDGDRFNEQLVKQLTGEDTLTARFLYGEFFDFVPQSTIWLRTNHRPVVRGTDDAIWRRFLMVPFEVQIPEGERDANLAAALRNELPGILKWAVEGALAWYEQGLNPPAAVLAATDQYRNESDLMGAFLDDCCHIGPAHGPTVKADLFDRWKKWCRDGEYVPGSAVSFSRRMNQRGFGEQRVGASSTRAWAGVKLREEANSQMTFRLRSVPQEAD